MTDNKNIAEMPAVKLDDDELLGLRQFTRVSAPDTARPASEFSKLLSKVGEVVPG